MTPDLWESQREDHTLLGQPLINSSYAHLVGAIQKFGMKSQVVWLCVAALELAVALKFSSVTEQVNLQDVRGKIEAFADFNADKATDILVLNATSSTQAVYLWDSGNKTFQRNDLQLSLTNLPSVIAAVRVADFDGDGIIDLLTLSGAGGPCYTLTVHWVGVADGRIRVENSTNLSRSVKDHPLVLDANGDHVPDLLTANCTGGQLTLWYSQGNKRMFVPTLLHATPLEYLSSYFVDLNSDCLADLVIYGQESNGEKVLELWQLKSQTGHLSGTSYKVALSPLLGNRHLTGDFSFADMDGDGVLEAVVSSCNDSNCLWPTVHILYQQKYPGTDVLNCQANSSWTLNFTHVASVNLQGQSSTHFVQPVIGDVNLDGFPDIITAASRDRVSSQPLFLLAMPCRSENCNGSAISLQFQWDLLPGTGNISQVAFFDLYEDGILDVLASEWGPGEGGEGGRMAAFRQSLSEDHTFLKVLVLSGHCFSHCLAGVKPYGSLLPGAAVAFSTTDRNGGKEHSTAVIFPGSPLQLPFVIFGLGETPNFIEALIIGAGHPGGTNGSQRVSGRHQWSSLVPNSQVVVITTPPDNPGRWRLELYLTPSRLVYSIAGVLCSVAVGIAILVALLHIREKYQDSKARRQAKHRFHFNAM